MAKILIVPDSFKGTLTAGEVCDIIGEAFTGTIENCEITKLPVADGGEGLCACLERISGGEFRECEVSGVFGERMKASYLMLPDKTAVIETASCAGLPLAGENKNPLLATTGGVGELIENAAENGAERILLGLGGSATNDCGACMAAALGWKFFDENGDEINPVGGSLIKIRKTVRPGKSAGIPVTAACDVDNPLYGESGAAYVFAPQKGADESAVSLLDEGLRNIARVIENDTGMKVADIPGAGAAGGMGAGVIAFLGGELRRGIDIILDIARFDEKAQDADLIITGEGRLDSQSINGKVISGIAKRAKKAGKRVITVCGCAGEGYEEIKNLGVGETYFSCPEPKPWDEVVKDCRKDLYSAALKAAEDFAKKYNKTTGLV